MPEIHGFELLREQAIPELNSHARHYRHTGTGAELLALSNADENKTFGVAFRTLPADHTGVAHILEHSVLGGSEKYPVKEPFLELLKGSLATFVNAFTAPDSTVYPVASQNLQDFYNLMDVYLDAVFHPRLTRHTFEQEGWHYEMDAPDAPLAYRGIVFNEMKGSYASPDNVLFMESLGELFPDTVYGHRSGGNPRYIPDLAYEDFKAFYARHYHPSNARFFLYGDLPMEEAMARLDACLADFGPGPQVESVALQPPFDAPRSVRIPYMAGGEETKAYVTVNWVLMGNEDPANTLAFSILEYALIGSPASPVRKALIDSGLGEDLAGLGGLDLRQLVFSAGLKGVELENTGKVEPLILHTLEQLARDGLEPEMIEAAVNTLEFALRENNAYGGQRGLSLMERALATWLHGGDPLSFLAFEEPLAAVKSRLQSDPRYFEEFIQAHLLDNPHRLTVLLGPDLELRQRQEAEERERLAAARARMGDAEVQAIVANTRLLEELQNTPNSPEALATLPFLQRSDLDRSIKRIPIEIEHEAGTRILYHPLPTNGIVYLDLGLDLRLLPEEALPYVALFGRALLEMGTRAQGYVRLSQRIDRMTGGIDPSFFASESRVEGAAGPVWLFLRGKATADKGEELLSILRDVLLTVRLDNQERFRQIVLEEKARREAGIVGAGHRVAARRLRAHFSETGWASEQAENLGALFSIRKLAQDVERDWPAVLGRLESIRDTLVNRAGLLSNVTLDAGAWPGFRAQLASFLADLPGEAATETRWTPSEFPANEAFSIPAQVNYVAKGADLYRLGYTLHGSVLVIEKYLNTTWLWNKIRAQGGAYGGFATFDTLSGIYAYVSYRDPNLLSTLDNYDATAEFLRQLDIDDSELTKSIIGAVGDLEPYQLPDAKGFTSMARTLVGQTDELRQQIRDEVLSTTAVDFRAFADVLDAVRREGQVVILGAEDNLRAADEARGGWLTIGKAL
jgi:hypothetical protein